MSRQKQQLHPPSNPQIILSMYNHSWLLIRTRYALREIKIIYRKNKNVANQVHLVPEIYISTSNHPHHLGTDVVTFFLPRPQHLTKALLLTNIICPLPSISIIISHFVLRFMVCVCLHLVQLLMCVADFVFIWDCCRLPFLHTLVIYFGVFFWAVAKKRCTLLEYGQSKVKGRNESQTSTTEAEQSHMIDRNRTAPSAGHLFGLYTLQRPLSSQVHLVWPYSSKVHLFLATAQKNTPK